MWRKTRKQPGQGDTIFTGHWKCEFDREVVQKALKDSYMLVLFVILKMTTTQIVILKAVLLIIYQLLVMWSALCWCSLLGV